MLRVTVWSHLPAEFQNRNLTGIPPSQASAINMGDIMNTSEPANPADGRANSIFVRSTQPESRPVTIRLARVCREDATSPGQYLILLRQQRIAQSGLAGKWGRTVAEL